MARRKTQTEEEPIVAEVKVDASEAASGFQKIEQDIPEGVQAILKTFSNYPELMITSQGLVFTPGCKLAAARAAILYKNPFYNS